MSIWWILINRFTKHVKFHLLIPLIGGIIGEGILEAFIASRNHKIESWISFSWVYLFSLRTVVFVAGVLGSYLLVTYILIKRETSLRTDDTSLAVLQDTLNDAKNFFGLSIIPLEEWFDPSIQVYLAKLLNRKLAPDDFNHERTLLFFSRLEFKKATLPLTDEYHNGRCLAHMHKDCDIPLSFLRREAIFQILERISPEDREALGCYPAWTKWRLSRGLRRVPLHRLRRRIKQLDFAVVEKFDDTMSVLRVAKCGEEVRIDQELTGECAEPYIRLLAEVRNTVYHPKTKRLKANHDFVRIYYG